MANKQNIGGGGHLRRIRNAENRIPIPVSGVTVVNSKADFGVAVGGKIRLIDTHHYVMNATVDLGTDVLEGIDVIISGDLTLATLLFTNSASPLITAIGDGVIQLVNLLAANISGPFLDAPLGAVLNRSVLFLDTVRFTGDLFGNGTGTGTFGTVRSADAVIIDNCSFIELFDGIKFDGSINDISIVNTAITSRLAAPAFIGIEILATADLDITAFSSLRFSALNVADRCVNFSTSATYGSPIRVSNSTIRGLGTFVAVGGLQKTDPDFIATANEGTTAPVNSQFAANASFQGNTVVTVIGAGNQGVEVPIGNGNGATHALFNAGAFVERFSLDGAEAQLQAFTLTARDTGTYEIDLHAQLNRAGGGTVFVLLGIQVEGVTVPDSRAITEVGNAATSGYATTTVELDPGDEVRLVIANNTSNANLIVNSASWRLRRL